MATSSAGKKHAPRKAAAARGKLNREAAPWNLRPVGGLQILEAPPLAQLDWLVHGFSTRPGGASALETLRDGRKATGLVLNLGFTEWDTRERVLANREKFFAAVGAGKMRVAGVRQIHSDMVHRADAPAAAQKEDTPQGDALVARDPGVLLVVQTADCIPVLLADTRQRAVAAIHAGWRGTVRRIVEKTLGRMQMEFGTRLEDVIAALGPGIGRCCYEVGSDVAKEFHAQFAEAREWFEGPFDALAAGENDPNWLPWLTMRPPGHAPPPLRAHLDLIAANRAMLTRAGVPPENIFSSGYCTACRTDLFFSHRRERTTGRMMAVIGIR